MRISWQGWGQYWAEAVTQVGERTSQSSGYLVWWLVDNSMSSNV